MRRVVSSTSSLPTQSTSAMAPSLAGFCWDSGRHSQASGRGKATLMWVWLALAQAHCDGGSLSAVSNDSYRGEDPRGTTGSARQRDLFTFVIEQRQLVQHHAARWKVSLRKPQQFELHRACA